MSQPAPITRPPAAAPGVYAAAARALASCSQQLAAMAAGPAANNTNPQAHP